MESDSLAEIVKEGRFAIDERALIPRVLAYPPNHPGETPYAGIVCAERATPETVSDIEEARTNARRAASAIEAAALVVRTLEGAVARALVGVRRVAVMTGGGLDSGALLALAVAWARRTGGSAFAVALDYEAEGDDRPHLRALEQHLGCEVVRVAPEQAAHRIGLYRGVDASPFTWPTAAMEVELMARGRQHGAECMLSGAGGDQLFDGEPRSLALLARRGAVRSAIRAARSLRGFDRPRWPVASWVARPLVASMTPRRWRRRLVPRARPPLPGWAGPVLVDWLRAGQDRSFTEAYASGERARAAEELSDRVYREYLAWLRHQESVASDFPRADPYLDRAVIATVKAIPPEWLLHGGERRGLFREALRGHLPESVRARQDKAAFEPAIVRFAAAARGFELMRACASGARLAALGIVDAARFGQAFERFAHAPLEDAEAWVSMWPALCTEAFLAAHHEGQLQ